MNPDDSKRSFRRDMLLAGALLAAGLVVAGLSLTHIKAGHAQVAQYGRHEFVQRRRGLVLGQGLGRVVCHRGSLPRQESPKLLPVLQRPR